MEKMIWLVIAIVIMFVMVAILASFFQSGINKGGGTTEDLADQSSWKSMCSAWCINVCMAEPDFNEDIVSRQSDCDGYWCNCNEV